MVLFYTRVYSDMKVALITSRSCVLLEVGISQIGPRTRMRARSIFAAISPHQVHYTALRMCKL